MNRDILFRGKKIGTKEWVFGSLVIAQWDNPIENENNELIYLIYSEDEHTGIPNYYGYSDLLFENRVIPDTVGQFTGLTDKNGTKIFEGDIVKATYGCEQMDIREFTANHVVEYKPTGYGSAIGFFNNLPSRGALEVIGNIYDNPELMEETE